MKNVLITGGAGFIGSHTADALLARGYSVRALDILDPQVHGAARKRPSYLAPEVELVVGDVRRRDDLEGALQGVDAVFHFAAQTGVGQSMYDIHGYCDVNINGTAMLLDVLANRANTVKKVILASSRAVYGEGAYRCQQCGTVYPQPRSRRQLEAYRWEMLCPHCGEEAAAVPTAEDAPLSPVSVYALTKKVQEDLVRLFSSTYGVAGVILRYFNVYGCRQAINNPYTGIGAIFTNRVLAGQEIFIYEDGRPLRDFVNVRDVVQANLLALENEQAAGGTFNVGSGEALTVVALAEKVTEKLGTAVPFTYNNQYRVGDIRSCFADLAASRSVLGYEPGIGFADGVAELVAWAKGEEVEDRYAEAADALIGRKLL